MGVSVKRARPVTCANDPDREASILRELLAAGARRRSRGARLALLVRWPRPTSHLCPLRSPRVPSRRARRLWRSRAEARRLSISSSIPELSKKLVHRHRFAEATAALAAHSEAEAGREMTRRFVLPLLDVRGHALDAGTTPEVTDRHAHCLRRDSLVAPVLPHPPACFDFVGRDSSMPSPAKRSSAAPRKLLSPRSRIAHGPNPCSRHCSSAARVSRNASSEFPDARACSASSSGERGVRISRAAARTIACSAESPTERPFTPLIIARALRGHSRTLAQASVAALRPELRR